MAFTRRRLVRPDRAAAGGDDAFRFDHVLIRDAAYAAITKGERARLHERLHGGSTSAASSTRSSAITSSRRRCTGRSSVSPTRARGEAAAKLGAAGRRTMWTAAHGVTLFERAVALEPDDGLARAQLDLGIAIKFSGDYAGGEAALDRVAETPASVATGASSFVQRSRRSCSAGRGARYAKEEAIRVLDEAAGLFESVGDDLSAARALHMLAASHWLDLAGTEGDA